MTTQAPTITRPLGLPRHTRVPDTGPAADRVVRPHVPATRPPSIDDLRDLATQVAASIATLPEGSPEAGRRADILLEALSLIVRLPSGTATVEDRATVSFREIQVVLRWLARLDDVAPARIVRAMTRVRSGLAAA